MVLSLLAVLILDSDLSACRSRNSGEGLRRFSLSPVERVFSDRVMDSQLPLSVRFTTTVASMLGWIVIGLLQNDTFRFNFGASAVLDPELFADMWMLLMLCPE